MPDPKSDSVSPATDAEKSEKTVSASQSQAVKDLEQAAEQSKLRDLPRSKTAKYTGNLYTNLTLNHHTGEVRKMLPGKANVADESESKDKKTSKNGDTNSSEAAAAKPDLASATAKAAGDGVANLIRNSDGKVSDIEYANGRDFASMNYDEQGNLKSVNGPIENLQKQADGSWLSTNMEPPGKYENVTVDENGVITMYEKGKKPFSIDPKSDFNEQSEKNATLQSLPDGVNIGRDQQGRVSEITYGNQTDGAYIQYDKDGKPEHINGPIENLQRQSDGSWLSTNTDPPSKYENVTVDENGVITLYEAGEKPYSIDPRTDFTADTAGSGGEIVYPDGTKAEIRRNESGEITELTLRDGMHLLKQENGWQAVNEMGEGIAGSAVKDVDVAEDGSIKLSDYHNNTLEYKPDGSQIEVRNEGSMVEVDIHGRPTKVTLPSPAHGATSFEYNDEGELASIDYGNGNKWTHESGETWKNDQAGTTWQGEIRVLSDGTYSYRATGETEVHTQFPDGSRMTMDASGYRIQTKDGATISSSTDDRINSIDYAGSKVHRDFEYDSKGISSVSYQNDLNGFKDTWKRQGDSNWVQYDDSGKPTGQTWQGEIAIDQENGEYIYQSKGSSEYVVERPDGSIVKADGNHVTEVTRSNGETISFNKYSDQGYLTAYKDSSGSWTSEDGIKWRNQDGDTRIESVTVDSEGTISINNGGETKKLLSNGAEVDVDNASDAKKFYDAQGQLTETIDPNNNIYKFTYNDAAAGSEAQLASVTEPDGITWTPKEKTQLGPLDTIASIFGGNKQVWVSADGQYEKVGDYSINQRDGSLTFKDESTKIETTVRPDGTHTTKDENLKSETYGQVKTTDANGNEKVDTPAVDRKEIETAAKAFHDAIGLMEATTDTDLMKTMLKGRSEAEITVMDDYYKTNYGVSLKEAIAASTSGPDKIELENLVDHVDGQDDNAGFIEVKLAELAETKYLDPKAIDAIGTEIRQKLASMNSEQIAQMNADFAKEDPEHRTVLQAISDNPKISQATKDAVAVYARGTDQLTQKDYQSIVEQSLTNGDLQQFKESIAHMSAEARQDFMANGGESKISEAFSHWYDSDEFVSALDYARNGRESLAHKIATETGNLNDNEAGIEAAVNEMSDADHRAFAEGRKIFAEKGADADPSSMTAEQRDSYQYYKEAHAAFQSAGNQSEVLKWEDKAIAGGEGTIISKALSHAGTVYDDKMGAVIADIENMSEKDFNEFKNNPDFQNRLQEMYSTYLNADEMARVQEVMDKKVQAEDFDAASQARRPFAEAVADAIDAGDEKAFLEAIATMTPSDRADFQNNKDGIRDAVKSYASDSGTQAAVDYLSAKIARGEETSKDDIVVKASIHYATETFVDEAQVTSEVLDAFKKDPTLRDRIINPQNDADRELATAFGTALSSAMGSSDYEAYIKPILETGGLTSEAMSSLFKGTIDSNETGFYEALSSLPAAERKKMQDDPGQYMSFMSAEDRAVAMNILAQDGKMSPEDKIRAYQLGAGTMEKEIKEMLSTMSPEEIELMKRNYAKKYDSNLNADLMSELSGKDLRDTNKMLERPQSSGEAFNDALDDARDVHTGSASQYSDYFNGTGESVDDAAIQFGKTVAEYSKNFQELPPDIQKQLVETMKTAVDAHKESKEAMADAMVNGIVTVAAVAGALPTGGVSLAGVGVLAAGGGAFKVAVKSTMMGESYDWDASAYSDFASGALDAAVSASIAGKGLANLGEEAATKTAEVMSKSASAMMKEGADAVLASEIKNATKTALESGAKEISEATLESIAKAYAKPGMEKAFQQELKETLEKEILAETKDRAKAIAIAFAEEVGASGVGGSAGGAASGIMTADYDYGFLGNLENMAKSAALSAATAAAGTVALKGLFSVGSELYAGLKGIGGKSLADDAITEMNSPTIPDPPPPTIPDLESPTIPRLNPATIPVLEAPVSQGMEPLSISDVDTPTLTDIEPVMISDFDSPTLVDSPAISEVELASSPGIDQSITAPDLGQVSIDTPVPPGDAPTGVYKRPPAVNKDGETNVAIPVSKKTFDADPKAPETVPNIDPLANADTLPNQQVIKGKFWRPLNRDGETQVELPGLKKPQAGADANAHVEATKQFKDSPTVKIETAESKLKKIQEAETIILKRPAELDAMWADTISGQLPEVVKAIQEAKTVIIQRPEGAVNLADAEVTIQIKLPEAKVPNRPPMDDALAKKIEAAKSNPLPRTDIDAKLDVMSAIDDEMEHNGEKIQIGFLDVNINGVDASLVKPGGAFYYDHQPGAKTGAVENKVHVEAANPEELAKMQAVLIPALKTDPALKDLVENWKTIDPRYGMENPKWATADGKAPSDQIGPGNRGQDAKAFTIYPKDAKAAEAIAKRIDEILAQYPEFRNKDIIPSGNADTLVGTTNRVGVVKDYIEKAPGSTEDRPQGLIDQEVGDAIKNDGDLHERAVASGVTALDQLSKELGLQPGILHEDAQGNIVIDLPPAPGYKKFPVVYMDESEAGKNFGEFNSRPAVYEIYKKYGYDPKDF